MSDPSDVAPYRDIPEAHSAAIGRVANAWANLEFEIDLTIWALMGVPQMMSACVTAQLMSIHPRLKALKALIETVTGSAKLAREVGEFAGKISGLVEARNRAVHDPRMVLVADDTVERLEITAQKGLSFGFQPESREDLEKTEANIKDRIKRFRALKARILDLHASLPKERRPKLRKISQVPMDREAPTS